jgi:hypothetical protein
MVKMKGMQMGMSMVATLVEHSETEKAEQKVDGSEET